MEIRISARHFELSDDLKQKIEQTVQKFSRFYPKIIWVEAILEQEATRDHRKKVEFVVHTNDHHTFAASEETDNFYTSLHKAADKVIRQLKKLKTRRERHS